MKNKIIWVVVTLILGALGSGLWELILRPALAFLGNSALDIVTLGLDSLRNDLYQEAARGQYERVGISVLSAISGTLAGITIAAIVLPFLLKRRLSNQIVQRSTRQFAISLLMIFTTTFVLLLFQRVIYVNNAINYFEQLCLIVEPYQTEQERSLIRSEYAQATTRQEYVAIVERLAKIAKNNNAKIPEFNIY